MGVRPEDARLGVTEQEGDLPAEVYNIEPLGDRNIYDVMLGKSLVRVKTLPTMNVPVGTRVYLTPNRDRIHLFNPRTGMTLLQDGT
jgi:multiple sugar transport system ATP-binding protein